MATNLKGEALEQAKLVNWLEYNDYKFTAIPLSTYTTSFRQKAINRMTGVRPGLCDMLIILKRGSLLFLEMKKQRGPNGGMNGSVISDEQIGWIKALNEIDNVSAEIAHGFEEGKAIVEKYERL